MQFWKRSQGKKFARRWTALLEGLESRVLMTSTFVFGPEYGITGVTALTGGLNAGIHPTNLIADSSGNLFGTTTSGGGQNYGTIFEIPNGTNEVLTLASFNKMVNVNSNQTIGQVPGYTPEGALVLDGGNLFGTTANGGLYNRGTIWELAAGSNQITTLYSFTGGNGGAYPTTGLVSDGAGNLWGTTYGGITNNNLGNIYEYSIGNMTYQSLALFPENVHPGTQLATYSNGTLAMDANNNVFVATVNGGNGSGSIYAFNTTTPKFFVLAGSAFNSNGTNNGSHPVGTLMFIPGLGSANNTPADGTLVGQTTYGGSNGAGTLFEAVVTSNATNTTNPLNATIGVLRSFQASASPTNASPGTNGTRPLGDLIFGNATLANGTWSAPLFGVTAQGNGNGNGEIYTVANLSLTGTILSNGTLQDYNTVTLAKLSTNLSNSTQANLTLNDNTGIYPSGGLALANGQLYLTTATQGFFQDGTVVQLTPFGQLTPGTAVIDHFGFSTQLGNTTVGKALGAITVRALLPNGQVDKTFAGTISLSILTGPTGSSLTGNVTLSQATSDGVVTFPAGITIDQAGVYTLGAADGSANTILPGQSARFIVNAGPATQLVVVQQPTVGSAGTQLGKFIVNVEDAEGNPVTSTSSVTLAIAPSGGPAGAKISGNTVSTRNGVATFSGVTLSAAGTYTLKVTDGKLPAVHLSSLTIGAAPTGMSISIPIATVPAGKSFEVDVSVVTSGNVAAGVGSMVTLSLASGNGPLFGTLTVPVGADGIAEFTDLTLYSASTIRFKAVDGKLVAPVSLGLTLEKSLV